MAREDLNPVEEARACALLVEELGLTREDVGRRVGRSRVAVTNLLRLLDLPDEVLELIADGALSEGHGRALLMASDHADRRRLARSAAGRAGASARPRRSARGRAAERARGAPHAAARAAVHPDQAEAAERIGDALGRALGAEVQVTPRGRRATASTLAFESLDEAMAVADRLGAAERRLRARPVRGRYHRPPRGRLAQSVRALL